MAAAQAAGNHWDKSSLTWYLYWGINTSIPTWSNSQNLLASAEVPLSLKISSLGNHKDHPIGKLMETETRWSKFPNGGKAIVEQILGTGERNKKK